MQYRSHAYGLNHYDCDPDLQEVLRYFWPQGLAQAGERLHSYGALAGREIYEIADYTDKIAPPQLVTWGIDGQRVDRVWLNPAQRALLERLMQGGINRPHYEGGSWHEHFALGYLVSDPGLYCTLTVTNQTAYVIYKYAPEAKDWLPGLTGQPGAELKYGATWLTEVQGGSDLGVNETLAVQDEQQQWRLSGEKYFASNAGLADLAVITARPEGAPGGAKGLALYLVSRLNRQGELNFLLRRLKEKSGTRSVPTGEISLEGSEAQLVGRADQGIYYALEMLTVSRLANAVAAVGITRKAHLEALGYVQERRAFGQVLIDHPLVRRDLLEMETRLAAGMLLTFKAIDAFDHAWSERPPYSQRYHYARLLSHLAKNRTAELAADLTRLAMELHGGIGFLAEFPVARWHREALITPIWEGTSNIQALDMLEVMQKKAAHEPFLEEFGALLAHRSEPAAKSALAALRGTLERLGRLEGPLAQFYAKEALKRLADSAQVALLLELAEQSGQERYARMAGYYAAHFLDHQDYPAEALADREVWGAVDALGR